MLTFFRKGLPPPLGSDRPPHGRRFRRRTVLHLVLPDHRRGQLGKRGTGWRVAPGSTEG